MQYRQLPHGGPNETFSVLGLGMGGIQVSPPEEIEAVVRTAIDNGINFFDPILRNTEYSAEYPHSVK